GRPLVQPVHQAQLEGGDTKGEEEVNRQHGADHLRRDVREEAGQAQVDDVAADLDSLAACPVPPATCGGEAFTDLRVHALSGTASPASWWIANGRMGRRGTAVLEVLRDPPSRCTPHVAAPDAGRWMPGLRLGSPTGSERDRT